METKKMCKRQGCRQQFTDTENNEAACKYHDGKPIFHDLKKGWTCCQVIVYDWDEFNSIKGCKTGSHDDGADTKTVFFQSQTVSNAQSGIDNFSNENKPVVKDIAEHERQEKIKAEEKKKLEAQKPKEILV
jgi:disease resistance protein